MEFIINTLAPNYNDLVNVVEEKPKKSKNYIQFPKITSAQRNHYEYLMRKHVNKTLTLSESKVFRLIKLRTIQFSELGNMFTTKKMAAELSIHQNSVTNAIKSLADKGLIFTDRNQQHRFIALNLAFTDIGYNPNAKSKSEWREIHKRLGIVIYRSLQQFINTLRNLNPFWRKTMLRDRKSKMGQLRESKKKNTAVKPRERFNSVDDVIDNTPTEMKRKKPKKLVSPDGYVNQQFVQIMKDKQAKYAKSNAEALDSIPKLKEKWEQGIRDRYGDDYPYSAWKGEQYGKAKSIRDNLRGMSPLDKQQFFYDAAYNWQEMTDKYFHYQVLNVDEGPSLGKFIGRVDMLLNEFRSRDVIRRIERLPDKVQQPTMAEKVKTKEQENNDYFELMINNIGSLDRQTREFSRLSIQQKKRLNSAYNQFRNPVANHMEKERSFESAKPTPEELQGFIDYGVSIGRLNPDGSKRN